MCKLILPREDFLTFTLQAFVSTMDELGSKDPDEDDPLSSSDVRPKAIQCKGIKRKRKKAESGECPEKKEKKCFKSLVSNVLANAERRQTVQQICQAVHQKYPEDFRLDDNSWQLSVQRALYKNSKIRHHPGGTWSIRHVKPVSAPPPSPAPPPPPPPAPAPPAQTTATDDEQWEDEEEEIPKSRKASKTCSAINCSNNKKTHPHLTFFNLPKDTARCKVWLQNMKRQDLESKPIEYCQKNLRLCSLHFEDSQFVNVTEKKRLNWNAVPRIFSMHNAPKIPNTRRRLTFGGPATRREMRSKRQDTPTKNKLKKATVKVMELRNLVRKKNREILRLKKQLEKSRQVKAVIEAMKPYLSEDEHELVSLQMMMRLKKRQVYSDYFRAFTIALYFKSPMCYRFLQTRFHLPSKSTINRWMSKIHIQEGFCPNLLRLLKVRVQRLKPEDRICCLMMDELSLKEHVEYNTTRDKVIGFSPCGGDKLEFATGSLVLLVSGLRGHFRQVLAHFFWKNAIPGDKLLSLVCEALDILKSVGLTVKVLSADQGSNFVSLYNLLGVTKKKPHFEHEGRKVYCVADVPHLLKSTRNCLSRNLIQSSTGEAHWSVITEFYQKDQDMKDARMAPKLKKVHFDLESRGIKMKVKIAAQTLSRTVSAGILTHAHFGQLGPHATSTAKFVMNINNLFDALNTSKERGITKYRSALTAEDQSPLMQFLEEMDTWLSTWKIINQKSEDVTSRFKFRDGWQMNIQAVKELVKELKADCNIQYLMTRRLCTDPLENLFSIVRASRGLERNPGPAGFTQTLKTAVTN